MTRAFFDPSRLDAFAERLASEGIAVGSDTVELPPDRLSGPELRLWFIDQLEPHTATYTIAAALRLRGRLDVPALRRAATAVVGRHEALRCRFPNVSGIPSAVIDPPAQAAVLVEDIADGDAVGWGERAARVPFDLASGPLCRFSVGCLGEQEHVLVLAIHHIVVDGAGLDTVLSELLQAYAGIELPDVIDRRRVLELTRAREDVELGYWRTELADLPPDVAIARDRERSPMATHAGGRLGLALGSDLRVSVDDCARRLRTTPAVVYHAAYRCLLARFSEAGDIAVGCPVNLREPGAGDAVGNFTNTLVVRSALAGDPAFADVVATVGDAWQRGLAHRRTGFERLVQELAPERTLERSPLFQVTFSHHSSPLESATSVAGLAIEPLGVETGTAMFDLGLQIADWRESTMVHLAYRADLYEEATAQRLLDAYGRIVVAVVERPELRLSELPVLEPHEQRHAEQAARRRSQRVADDAGVGGRFVAQAASAPDATAIVDGDRIVTYGELEERSASLAGQLEAGHPPEAPVALLLERRAEAIAAMLACARAGRPFVLMDPRDPPGRLERVVALTGVQTAIASPELGDRLGIRQLSLIDPAGAGGTRPATRAVPPGTALCIVVTSGPAGQPNGLVIEHAGLLGPLDAGRSAHGLGPEDVWTCAAGVAGALQVWEVLGALATGASVVVVEREDARDPSRMLDVLEDRRASVVTLAPDGLRLLPQLLVARQRRPPEALRLIYDGSGALRPDELRAFAELAGAECPEVVRIDENGLGSGVVLDPFLGPTPAGVPGELFTGGPGLARGYAGRPGLTAACFVPDPLVPGARMLRTGARARAGADGPERLGRADGRLALHGVVVDPGEIEAALLGVDGVSEAAIVLRERQLVGFVAGGVKAEAALRVLAEMLPERLMPSRLEIVPALQRGADGTIDRGALEVSDAAWAGDAPDTPPSTPNERILARAFQAALGVEAVGTQADFFQLGGDSLLAVQLAARASADGLAISVADVFAHPTLKRLAEVAAASDAAPAAQEPSFDLVADADRARLPPGIVDAYPLAAVQEGMLFHQAYGDGTHPYHMITTYEIGAPLDVALLQTALDRVYGRHPALRTSFDLATYSEPLQLIWPPAPVPLTVHRIRGHPRAHQERLVNEWMADAHQSPLAFDSPPLLRPHVHDAADDRFWLSFTECHAILDGWSLHLVLGELLETYETLLEGAELPVAAAPSIHYREHVAAERAARRSEEHGEFFRTMLEGAGATELGHLASGDGGSEASDTRRMIVLSPDAQRRLEERTRESSIPLKSVLLGLHAAILAVLAGSDDVVTATIFNGRPERPGAEGVCGMYLNRLPVRIEVGDRTFRELARAAFERESAIWAHRLFPAVAIAETNGGRRALALPATGFLYTRFWPLASTRDRGVELLGNAREIGTDDSAFASHWDHDPSDPSRHLALTIEARADLAASLDMVAALYRRMLAALVEDFDTRVVDVPLLDEAGVAALRRRNETGRSFEDADVPFHRLVERVARERPDRTAVVAADGTFTYGELDREANRLARVLVRRGLEPGELVCLSVRRDRRLPVAFLAVLKAGGAFVPIDPGHPDQRRRSSVEASGARFALDDSSLADWLVEAATEDPAPLDVEVPSESPCYVIFTSGSTGSPKGVVVPHRAIVNFLLSLHERHPITESDAVLFKGSISFDASLHELLRPLLAGCRLVLAEPGAERDPDRLEATIEREGVTECVFVPSALREFVNAIPPGRLSRVRAVFAGGENLSATLERDWRARFAGRLINVYGPTEATVDVSSHCGEGDEHGPSVPIGTPLANTSLHVLSRSLAPVPPGVPGELYIGGVQLAHGYLRDPALTASRFVPDPFDGGGRRLYRTGDRVRWLADGSLEFLGRIDDQVKVRGFRVEPGEVEAHLAALDEVQAAAVVERDGSLVAFVTGEVDPARARRALAARLPAHLVPSRVVVLDRMPTMTHGKLDRRALPAVVAAPALSTDFVAPRDEVEEILAEAFASVLGVERIGVFDSFFALGGDSILALRAVMRARSRGLQVTPALVFEHETIAGIAPFCSIAEQAAPGARTPDERADEPDLSQTALGPQEAEALLERVRESWR